MRTSMVANEHRTNSNKSCSNEETKQNTISTVPMPWRLYSQWVVTNLG